MGVSTFPDVKGVDWSDKNAQFFGVSIGTHQSETIFDITGSGYLTYIVIYTDTAREIVIQIDSGDIITLENLGAKRTYPFSLVRFNTSLKITASSSTSISAGVVLD